MFRKFVETNSGVVKYDSFGGEEEKDEEEKKEEEKKQEIDPSKIDFYNQYGLLILKFCKYHNYVFLNKEKERYAWLKSHHVCVYLNSFIKPAPAFQALPTCSPET